MKAHAVIAAIVIVLALACCPAAHAGDAPEREARFPIEGHLVVEPAPPGMVWAPDLRDSLARTADPRSAFTVRAVFVLDSATASPGSQQMLAAHRVPMAFIASARVREAVALGRAFIRAQQRDPGRLQPRDPADSATCRVARELVRRDPHGTAAFRIPVPPGARVTLAGFDTDSSVAGVVSAIAKPLPGADGVPFPAVLLGGQATVIAQDEGLVVNQQRFAEPTTRAVAAFRRDFAAWVQAIRESPPPAPSPPATTAADSLPRLGEFVYVDELPEAIQKVPPDYPQRARRADVQGTVMVQALVVGDGSVARAVVLKSIPLLDAAALAAVKCWRFRPATAAGKPVAVWVAIPVKFTLH